MGFSCCQAAPRRRCCVCLLRAILFICLKDIDVYTMAETLFGQEEGVVLICRLDSYLKNLAVEYFFINICSDVLIKLHGGIPLNVY